MTLIAVPRPQTRINPNRPVSSLLLTQVQHLHEAEKNLPLRFRSERYIKAIQTEGEAAEYIQEVTEAIHQAHSEASAERARRTRKPGIAIAAVAQPSKKARGRLKVKAKVKVKTTTRSKNSKRTPKK